MQRRLRQSGATGSNRFEARQVTAPTDRPRRPTRIVNLVLGERLKRLDGLSSCSRGIAAGRTSIFRTALADLAPGHRNQERPTESDMWTECIR
jgi:hypothetical protein